MPLDKEDLANIKLNNDPILEKEGNNTTLSIIVIELTSAEVLILPFPFSILLILI